MFALGLVGPNFGSGTLTLDTGSGGGRSITLASLSWGGDVNVIGDGASSVTINGGGITNAGGRLLTSVVPLTCANFALQGSFVSSATTTLTLTSATLAAATQFQVAPTAGITSVSGGVALGGAGAVFSFGTLAPCTLRCSCLSHRPCDSQL
jgi:hypothetical protein